MCVRTGSGAAALLQDRWDLCLLSHRQEQLRPRIAPGTTRKQTGLPQSVRTGLGEEEQPRLGCEGMQDAAEH